MNRQHLIEEIEKLENFSDISKIIKKLKNNDENILEKNFIEILNIFEKNFELFNFLISKKESEARDLIDGLFDNDNDENITIELRDIEILINAVCFIQELKNKTDNINIFLKNFHSLLDENNDTYKEILINLLHIDSKLYQLQEYIKIQLGKKYKYTANIEKFLSEGIIEFKKIISQPIDDILHKDTKKEKNPELYYEAIIKIGDKEEKFQQFMETIKKIKAKNIYKYGKNRDNFLKAQKIAQIVQGILKELNLNIKQEFSETYIVANLEFINKDVLKLPQLEKVLNDLKKKNNQIKSENLKKLDNDPSLQYLLNYDLYDTEEIKNREKIENYFPNIQEIEDKNKIIHKNFYCEECRMSPIIGVRYNCKTCENFNYCENCIEKKGVEHGHEFNKIEIPIEYEGIPSYLLIFNIFTQLKEELNNLNGLYFYKSSKNDYELDILKINNKFIDKFPSIGDKIPSILTKNLPFFFNLLLCNDNLDEYEIHSFCVRAINCSTNNLFFIVRPEELNIGNEKYFFKTINKLLEKKNYKINSCIIILYINPNSHIIKQLKKIRDKYELPEEPPIFKTIEDSPIEDLKDLPIELVTSDSPRVGKTEYIHKQLEDDETYFTITLGDIDNLFLLKNMYVLNELKNTKISIIIELYENTDENTKNLIRNFLFQFIILKVYGKYTYIDKDIKLFIEISSDYTTYYEDFKILKLFKKYHIELKNNPNFYDTYKINPRNVENLLIVLNYLELLKNGEINNILPLSNLLKTILDKKKTAELFISDYDSLIKEYLIKNFPIKNLLPNYGQIKIFSDLLGHLLLNLDLCSEMEPKNIKENEKYFPSLAKIRERIVLSYIEFVIKFSSLTYESILENQEIASKNQKIVGYKLSNELKSKLIEQLNKKKVISYNEIKPSIVLFNQIPKGDQYKDLNKCSILTTYKEGDKEYIELNQIYQDYLKQGELLSLSDFGAPQFKFELENICLTPNTEFIYINEKLLDYEFTMDNFVKMVLIYLRIKSNVPLILLGETGCGKTSLIQSLVYFLRGKYKLITYNIHAGLKYNDIMEFLLKEDLLEFNSSNKSKDTEIMNVIFKLLKINKDEKEEEKIILFLDEINTSNSLSLLSHLFTKRCFLGLPLKRNVYIIAACNPYRLMLSKNEDIGYRNKKMHNIRNLVYTVNPLPLCLINYVFDFGNLRDEDEEKYINKFVDSFMNSRFSKSNNFNYSNILEMICKAVYTSQKFIKKFSEISSVSLREIKRFRLFFEFFFNITKRRNEFSTPNISFNELKSMFVNGLSEEEIIENINILKAANLSIFMCYYLRIINSKLRGQLSEELTKVFKFDFLDYPLQLENELADNINLEKGIAKNRALLDNLFALFVCLNNKVPVFICGKAGCSKSLSFSLLFQSMKGEYSKSELFKKYPSLYVTSYQGSLTSSSNEIKTIFERAKKIVELEKKNQIEEEKQPQKKNKKKNGNLSVILFDEMGLAEISPNNPLKVIHSELDGNQEIGFVGISNWVLDASKMNRGIHLSVQEPDLDDLILTANTIAEGIYEEIKNNPSFKIIIENLTRSYYDYKAYLKEYYVTDFDFHGARDFYYLIKIASRLLKNNTNRTFENIALESIERNFGGLELNKEKDNKIWPSTKKVKQLFSKHQNNYVEDIDKYDIFSCIKNNLEKDNNRYLLLITKKTKNDTMIEFILKKLNLNYKFMQGSKLKEDQNEGYVLQKAWSIISSMENGEIIILKDLEIIFPKFYDLFNQNLQKFGNSQYAKIVLDSTTNEKHIVNKSFRCIVLLDQEEVNAQDPPFLNRFEKHLMSFRYLLTEKQNKIAKEIYNEIKDLTTTQENKENKKYLPLLVNINLEEIRSLLLDLSMKVDNIENNAKEIYKLLIPTFTQENILNSIFSPQKKYIKKDDIIQIYEENTHTNIFKFLENVENNKLIVYTFSPYYKDIFTENNKIQINNLKLGITISKDNTIEIIFNKKLSERMLNYFFNLYYENIEYNLFIIHFRIKDSKFLKYVKFQIDNFHKENKENPKKIFLFIIHLEKNYDKQKREKNENEENNPVEYLEKYHSYFFSFLSEYQQITIDNLLEQRNISVVELFKKSNEELLVIKELFDVNSIIKKEFSRQLTQMASNREMDSIIDQLDNLLENGVLDCIIKKIQNYIKTSDNLLRQILIDYSSLLEKDFDFISYFIEKIELILSNNVEKLIKELGRCGFLVSYIFEKEIPSELKIPIFSFINNINLAKIKSDDNIENYSLDLKIPGSRLLIKKLFNLAKNCKIEYLNKEEEYRKGIKKKEDKKNPKKVEIKTLENAHFEKKQYLKSRLWNEELLSDNIFSKYSSEILKDLFNLSFYDENKKASINENQEKFLEYLYLKRNEGENKLDEFLYFYLWIASYHEIIYKLLQIFEKLDKYFKIEEKEEKEQKVLGHNKQSLLESIKDSYNLFEITEKDKERKSELEQVNGIFYRISESICHIVTNINNIDFIKIDLKQFCADLNEIAQILIQFDSTLILSLKGQYSLISMAKVIEYSEKKKINEEEFKIKLKSFIKNIYDEKCFLLNKEISQAKKAFNEQLKFIIHLSDELCMKIMVNKLLQYFKFEDYKFELVKAIFEYPQLIKHSSLFFNYIFLIQPIKPKKQTKKKYDSKEYLNKFGEIKNLNKNQILLEINKELENNEILKEILIYIFELRLMSYFEECKKTKIVQENPSLLLLGLNFEYYAKACNDINNNNFGSLNNLGMIFYYSFIRCYLYNFVIFQINNKKNDIGDFSPFHKNLFDISNSSLGKMIILYIANLFIINNEKDYFLNEYLKDVDKNNWKGSILSKNDKLEFFPISKYENSKYLLFSLWLSINNNNLNAEYINNLEIIDLYYIINFAYNEIGQKKKDDEYNESKILTNNNLKSIKSINKIQKLFNNIWNLDFYKSFNEEANIKDYKNIKLIFNMIRIYIISFAGVENKLLFSLIHSDNIISLIKIAYNENLKEKLLFIDSYYQVKNYYEEEYLKKDNYYPVYVCSCGRWYSIPNSLPVETKDCKCGSKIGGKNETLESRENHFAIYYDEKQKNFIESGRANKISNKCKIKGILLKEFFDKYIQKSILDKCPKVSELLLNNNDEINNNTFSKALKRFIFLSLVFIDDKIGIISEEEKRAEFNKNDISDNILHDLVILNNKIEDFCNNQKENSYHDFMNYFCELYYEHIKSVNILEQKEKFNNFLKDLLKIQYEDQTFKNIEMNILTTLTYGPNFTNKDMRYLLTAAKYPNLEELKINIESYTQKKRALPILEAFIKIDKENSDIGKLAHLEIINDFINSFSEETSNLISRQTYESEKIEYYLNEIRNKSIKDEDGKSPMDIQFNKFCESYEEITNTQPLSITSAQPVMNILNDDKIQDKKTPINKLYCHLIDIQNEFLNKIIDDYNNNKNELKEDIIIKNAIEQIKKEIPIQLATKGDIFSFNVSNNIILSFEELFSFYSFKNIFNEKNDKIDYSNYSKIKFKLKMIEKELVNIILTGKKKFSEKQLTYKFYLDPYEIEEKTKNFQKFSELYGREEITQNEKIELSKSTEDLKKIILPNLEILIFYLIKETKYQGKQKINEIKFISNLYLNDKFIELFKNSKTLTINKLISIYEFMEERIWDFIQDRYVNKEFKKEMPKKLKIQLDEYYNEEEKRELKNDMIASLLIKFICRYLPYLTEKEINENNDLFEMLMNKNINLSENIKKELVQLQGKFGAKLYEIIDITGYFVKKNNLRNKKEKK